MPDHASACDADHLPGNRASPDDGMLISQNNLLFKFIIIGDLAVGKTNLRLQFTEKMCQTDHHVTVGVEFGSKTIDIDGKQIKIQIWDTGGADRFRSIVRNYFRGASGALLVYDITQRDSFDGLSMWLQEISANADPDIAITLVGNKCDKVAEREVLYVEGLQFAQRNGMLFLETSSVAGAWVDEAFEITASRVHAKSPFHDAKIVLSPGRHVQADSVWPVPIAVLQTETLEACQRKNHRTCRSIPDEIIRVVIDFLTSSELGAIWIPLSHRCFCLGICYEAAFRAPVKAWRASAIQALDQQLCRLEEPSTGEGAANPRRFRHRYLALQHYQSQEVALVELLSSHEAVLIKLVEKVSEMVRWLVVPCHASAQLNLFERRVSQFWVFEYAEIKLRVDSLGGVACDLKARIPDAELLSRWAEWFQSFVEQGGLPPEARELADRFQHLTVRLAAIHTRLKKKLERIDDLMTTIGQCMEDIGHLGETPLAVDVSAPAGKDESVNEAASMHEIVAPALSDATNKVSKMSANSK